MSSTMAKVSKKPSFHHNMKPFKYEMARRKKHWKRINEPIEKLLRIPPESQQSVVQDLVSELCYNNLAPMLGLPSKDKIAPDRSQSVETKIPYIPVERWSSFSEHPKRTSNIETEYKLSDETLLSGSEILSDLFSLTTAESHETLIQKIPSAYSDKGESDYAEFLSYFVEVEQKIPSDLELIRKHKAILKFLNLPESEAASWRVKETKDVSELSEMTLEEQGDFLINKIAVDFCEWLRKLGGDEKSFINEEILKELFQIGMDNPASRAICIKTRERRVLDSKLADFLGVPEKSFHEVLSAHLNWDSEVEKQPSKLIAFGKNLPKELRFKTPKNKTAETWLEWNKLSNEQLSFADVYSSIKDLRSTKEYCNWLKGQPQHKKPKYLVDQGMFNASDVKSLTIPQILKTSVSSASKVKDSKK